MAQNLKDTKAMQSCIEPLPGDMAEQTWMAQLRKVLYAGRCAWLSIHVI